MSEPLRTAEGLRVFLFGTSLGLLASGQARAGALLYLFFFTLDWAVGATTAKTETPVRPEVIAAMPGCVQAALSLVVRLLSLCGIVLWLFEMTMPVAWCVVPALSLALRMDAVRRSRRLLAQTLPEPTSFRAVVWVGVFLGIAMQVPAALFNLFIALPSLDFFRGDSIGP